MQKIVAGLISRKRTDSNNEYLFIEYVKYPGLHGLCGGHVDKDEDTRSALVREFHEELGVSVDPIKVRHTMKADIEGEEIEIWDCNLADDKFSLQKEEITSINWFSPQEVLDHPEHFFSAIYNFFKNEYNLLR